MAISDQKGIIISVLFAIKAEQSAVECKLLDLGHTGLGQRDWDMRYKDSGTGTCGTRTAGLGHALQGQRDWDMRN